MIKDIKKKLEKQGHRFVGEHCAVKICRWTRKSLTDSGDCYKSKFYGIDSSRCCQMSPWLECQNKCIHCWRPIEFDFKVKGKINSPKEIIKQCIEQQRKLLSGFKGNKKINLEKLKQAQEPKHFAISLTGEPTLYQKLGELILELNKQNKTSFLVTNGLQPEVLEKLQKQNALPTQLYVSMNSSNEKDFLKWHKSSVKDCWKKFNQTLELLPDLSTRKVIRITLVKGLNNNMGDKQLLGYAKLLKKAKPDFIEVKGYMSVGFARNRKGMGYESMPTHKEIKDYAKKIAGSLLDYDVLDEHEFSRVVLIGRGEEEIRIKV